METPPTNEDLTRVSVVENRDVYIAPYEVEVDSGEVEQDVSVRITGADPRIVFAPDQENESEQDLIHRFVFPDLTVLEICQRFIEEGLTDEVIAEIREEYDRKRSPFYGLFEDAKSCLEYPEYIDLLDSSAGVDEVVKSDLANSRHRFVKNLIRGQRAGSQYPIRDYSEFRSRIAEFDTCENLDSVNEAEIITEVVKDASNHETHIDDICRLKEPFVDTADGVTTGFFVNMLSEALLTELAVETATNSFENGFGVDPWELVRSRYEDQTVDDSYRDIQEEAYETREIEDWEQALAAVDDPESSQFYQAVADLLYWYTEDTRSIPSEIQPQVYATAEALYEKAENGYMTDAAAYRACLTEGRHQRSNGSFENPKVEFYQARSIASGRDGPPFDEVKPFVESVLTDIIEKREQAEFMKAYEKAEYGHSELTEGEYQALDTESKEKLLEGWKYDLRAQHQRANKQFDEAIKTTGKAIKNFREAGAEGLAQTAQTRRYQIQAIVAQLKPDFDEAANHHRNAQEESADGQTAHFHEVQTELCSVKKYLLEQQVSEARTQITELDTKEPAVENLGILIDVYTDYLQSDITPVDSVIEQLEISSSVESDIGRHIMYDGDYVSAAILVAASQRLKERNIAGSVLDHLTKVVIKNAVSGDVSEEWSEVTELSQIDAENIWRQLIPSVVLTDIEYVERLSRQPHPNYAAQGMKLLAALEGYLRVLVEYYAKQAYDSSWDQEVVSGQEISLGDLYTFFESDEAVNQLRAADEIRNELGEVRYFDSDSRIIDVRNDLDHNDLNWLDEASFERLRERVFQIMRWSAPDCPVISEIDGVNQQHGIYFGSAKSQWHSLPRRVEVSTQAEIKKGDVLYLPPHLDTESGVAQIDPEYIEQCELKPEQFSNQQ